MPDSRPRLVRPGQAERVVGASGRNHLGERPFEQASAIPEPIMPVAESLDPMLSGKVSLLFSDLGHSQVIEPEVRR